MNYNDQVTMLNDLPHLRDIEAPSNDSIQSHIRNTHQPPAQSGMSYTNAGAAYSPLPSNSPPNYNVQPPMGPPPAAFYEPAYHPMEIEQYDAPKMGAQPTCLDINGHISGCPICTKFYGSNERIIYIIALVILAVICLLLLKKILDDKA